MGQSDFSSKAHKHLNLNGSKQPSRGYDQRKQWELTQLVAMQNGLFVDLPMKRDDFPEETVSLLEGIFSFCCFFLCVCLCLQFEVYLPHAHVNKIIIYMHNTVIAWDEDEPVDLWIRMDRDM